MHQRQQLHVVFIPYNINFSSLILFNHLAIIPGIAIERRIIDQEISDQTIHNNGSLFIVIISSESRIVTVGKKYHHGAVKRLDIILYAKAINCRVDCHSYCVVEILSSPPHIRQKDRE